MGKSTFSGPIRTGRRNTPTTNTYGHVMAAIRVPVSSRAGAGSHIHTAASQLPSCNLVDITCVIETPFAATVAAISHLKIGTTANASAFGSMLLLSEGVYKFLLVDTTAADVEADATSALSLWSGVAEGTRLLITVTAAITANTSGRGNVYIQYFQNSAATV